MTHVSSSTPEEQVAVITGGGTGLGLATGMELRMRGYRVVALGLDTEPELEGSGIEFEKMDITDEAAMAVVAARLPQVGVLINAAGIIQHGGAEFTIAGFRKVVDVNLSGAQLACILFRPALAATHGSIVNFASM